MIKYINVRYEIVKKLGEGATGTVFLVQDALHNKKDIALKTIHAKRLDPQTLNNLKKEFLILKQLDHPNLAKVFDFGKIATSDLEQFIGDYFFTLSYIEGKPLYEATENASIDIIYNITYQLAVVLDYIHRHGLIHFDIKPDNILLTNELIGEKTYPLIKIIDFGFASTSMEGLSESIRGSLEYLAPELIRGESFDYRIDLYSLGATLFHTIARRPPFIGESPLETLKMQVTQPVPPLTEFRKDVPENLTTLIRTLLEKDPDKRFNKAKDIIKRLELKFQDFEQILNYIGTIPSSMVVGREREISTLMDRVLVRWRAKGNGKSEISPHIVAISGESGIGKTSLINELKRNLQIEEVPVFTSRCDPGISSPYEPFKSIIKELYFTLKTLGENGNTLIRKYNRVFAAMIGDRYTDGENLGNSKNLFIESKSRLHKEIGELFSEVDKISPFTVIIDDIHYTDSSSLDLLQYLVGSMKTSKSLMLISLENEEFLKNFLGHKTENVETIRLEELNVDDIRALLNILLDVQNVSEDLINLLKTEVGGSPYMVKEFLLLFSNLPPDKIPASLGRALSEPKEHTQFPRTITELYSRRQQSLKAEEFNLLCMVSCFKKAIDVNLLQRIAPFSPARLAQFLSKLTHTGLLVSFDDGTKYHFAQRQFQKFIYDSIGEEKKQLHIIIAEELEKIHKHSVDEFAEQIAYHYQNAEEYEKAFEYYVRAAHYARSIFAFRESNTLLEKANAIGNREGLSQRELLEQLAEGYMLVSDYVKAEKIYLNLLEQTTSSDTSKFTYLKSLGISRTHQGKLDESIISLNEALLHAPTVDERIQVEDELVRIDIMRGEFRQARERCEKVLESISDRTNYPGASVLYDKMGTICFYENNLEEAAQYFYRSLRLLERTGEKDKLIHPYSNLGNIYSSQGDYNQAERYWNKALSLCREIGSIQKEALILNNLGVAAYNQQKYSDALKNYTEAMDLFGQLGNLPGEAFSLTNIGEVYLAQSKPENALRSWQKSLNLYETLNDNQGLAETHNHLAEIFLSVGDVNNVKKHLQIAQQVIEEAGIESQRGVYFLLSGGVAHLEGEYEIAEDFYNKAKIFFKENKDNKRYCETIVTLAELHHQLKNYDRAIELLTEAVDICTREHFPTLHSQALYIFGVIAEDTENPKLEKSITYVKKAFSLIADETVPDISWKICFFLGNEYLKRGLSGKAMEFFQNTKKILEFLASGYSNKLLHSIFWSSYARGDTFKAVEAKIAEFSKI